MGGLHRGVVPGEGPLRPDERHRHVAQWGVLRYWGGGRDAPYHALRPGVLHEEGAVSENIVGDDSISIRSLFNRRGVGLIIFSLRGEPIIVCSEAELPIR